MTDRRRQFPFRPAAPVVLAAVLVAACGAHNRAAADSALGSLPRTSTPSPLAGLPFARDGKILHAGSWDRSGGNADARPIPAGKSLVLLDYQGAGIVRRFWVTIAPEGNPHINRGLVLRAYWDGETKPSVEVPIGDFFGAAFGQKVDFISLPLELTSGGMNCYWPMPFHRSARIVVDNESPDKVDAFYYNMEVETHRSLPADLLEFHARWNRENPTHRDKNYTILEAAGRGHYVGTYLQMTRHEGQGLGFLEGDEMVYVDGEKTPSINGTGTEDFFSSGWYFDRGPYSAPYHGLILKADNPDRVAAYRWQIEDAVPFRTSIRFTIEHGNQNDTRADYTSVAYWYQALPDGPQPPLLPYPERLPDYNPLTVSPVSASHGHILGEDLISVAKGSTGDLSVQEMAGFKAATWPDDAQLWWRPGSAGATLQLTIPVAAAGTYDGSILLTKAVDYGSVDILVNGTKAASFTGYAAGTVINGQVSLGKLTLNAGPNTITLRVSGKDPSSTGYFVGIGELDLKPAT